MQESGKHNSQQYMELQRSRVYTDAVAHCYKTYNLNINTPFSLNVLVTFSVPHILAPRLYDGLINTPPKRTIFKMLCLGTKAFIARLCFSATPQARACDGTALRWIPTHEPWIYGSVLSGRGNYKTGPLGHHCTALHSVVQTRAEERENIRVRRRGPRTTSVTPTLNIYLNFHGLAQVLQGHLSPHDFPSFTPKNSKQRRMSFL